MYEWRKHIIENDPDDPIIIENFIRWYRSHRSIVSSWEKVTLKICRGKRVIDIGAICHNKQSIVSVNWKHRKIHDVSEYVLGVDILNDMIQYVNRKGWNFVWADATSSVDLNERFEVAVIGDLIEHVDNVGGLLNFAKRHLNKGGVIIITTPNPLYFELVNRAIFEDVPIANMEHTGWITPTNMNELCYRSGIKLNHVFEVIPKHYDLPRYVFNHIPRALKVQSYIYICRI